MNNRRLTKGRFGLRAWCCLARDAFRFPDDDDGGFDIFDECSLHFDDAVTAKRVAAFRIRAETQKQSLSLSLSLSSLSFCHARVFLKALSLAYLGDFFCLSLETLKKRKEKCRGMPLFCCSTTPLLNASKKNSSRFRHNINARALLELSTGHLCIHSPPLFGGTH